jgi:CBS domain-containing protein
VKVEEIMVPEVKVCALSDTLNRAAQLMWENDCGCIPVVESASQVVGMITDRDICMAAYTRGTSLHNVHVSHAMSPTVFACAPGDDLLAAQRIMREHRVRRLPVISGDGKLVGIVSLDDIARAANREATSKSQVADTLAAICTPWGHQLARPAAKAARTSQRGRKHKQSAFADLATSAPQGGKDRGGKDP